MRTWCVAVLCACVLVAPQVRAQDGLPAGQAQKEFDALLARVKQSDPTVDFARLRLVFSQSDAYRRSRDEAEPALREAFSMKAFPQALSLAREILDRNYLNFDAHFVAMMACTELKDETCETHHRYVARGILDSIAESGDGKSPATAWTVIAIPEEYAFMAAQGFEVTEQSLMEQSGHAYDVLTVRHMGTKEESRVYFNVDLSMAALKRMLSAPAR